MRFDILYVENYDHEEAHTFNSLYEILRFANAFMSAISAAFLSILFMRFRGFFLLSLLIWAYFIFKSYGVASVVADLLLGYVFPPKPSGKMWRTSTSSEIIFYRRLL